MSYSVNSQAIKDDINYYGYKLYGFVTFVATNVLFHKRHYMTEPEVLGPLVGSFVSFKCLVMKVSVNAYDILHSNIYLVYNEKSRTKSSWNIRFQWLVPNVSR